MTSIFVTTAAGVITAFAALLTAPAASTGSVGAAKAAAAILSAGVAVIAAFTTATAAAAITAAATALTAIAVVATATAATTTTAAAFAPAVTTTTAAAVAAATTTTAAKIARGARFHGTRFVDDQVAPAHRLAVNPGDGGLRLGIASHFHETETFGTSAVTLHHDLGAGDRAELLEQLCQILIAHSVRQVAHIQFITHD